MALVSRKARSRFDESNLPGNIRKNLENEIKKYENNFGSSDYSNNDSETELTIFDDPNFMVLLPTSCSGCQKELSSKQDMFVSLQKNKSLSFPYMMQKLGITRDCCKRHFMGPAVIPMGAKKKPQFDVSIREVSENVNKFLIGSVTSRRLNEIRNNGTAQFTLQLKKPKRNIDPDIDIQNVANLDDDMELELPDIDDGLEFMVPDLPDISALGDF